MVPWAAGGVIDLDQIFKKNNLKFYAFSGSGGVTIPLTGPAWPK